jgi:hypothetical protein
LRAHSYATGNSSFQDIMKVLSFGASHAMP